MSYAVSERMRTMKRIILTCDAGARFCPLSAIARKRYLQVYDNLMVRYQLSTLMLAGIRGLMVKSNLAELSNSKLLLGDGLVFCISLYAGQQDPDGGWF